MTDSLEVTTDVACRVVGINPLRLNEHVASGRFPCMPSTLRGRYRVFDIHDLTALWLFRNFIDEGLKVKNAGYFACAIADKARNNPDATAISIVESAAGARSVHLSRDVPERAEWGRILFSGFEIAKVTTFNVALYRKVIASGVAAQLHAENQSDQQ